MSVGGIPPAWDAYVPGVVAQSRISERSLAYLHLPKTGGSSVGRNLYRSAQWSLVRLPASYIDPTLCACGADRCVKHLRDEEFAARSSDPEKNLFVKFGHERYDHVRRFIDAVEGQGGRIDMVLTAVRPARARLESMFRDYWTQVDRDPTIESDHDLGELNPEIQTSHMEKIIDGYRADAVHYLDGEGNVDGRAWFSAFAQHGPGMAFLLCEVFDESVDLFRSAIESGTLKPIPTRTLDSTLTSLIGVDQPVRTRISSPIRPATIERAIADARDLIDEIALRDAEFDTILSEHLDDPSFRP